MFHYWSIRRTRHNPALFEVRPWWQDFDANWHASSARVLAWSPEGARAFIPAGACWAHVEQVDGEYLEWWAALPPRA